MSCHSHYDHALERLTSKFLENGDTTKAEHLQLILSQEDVPLCKTDEEFMDLTNNPAEQNMNVYKGHKKGRKNRRRTLTQWTRKTLDINVQQSKVP